MSDNCLSILVRAPGAAPRQVASHSNYHSPLEPDAHGRSRRWGDASIGVQKKVIGAIIRGGEARDLSAVEISFALAVARHESGFNPDAAAGTTSASGVGQMIDDTAFAYGVPLEARFSFSENIEAFLSFLHENLDWAKEKGGSVKEILTNAYARYHDGPSLKYGGRKIAEREVVPWSERIYQRCF